MSGIPKEVWQRWSLPEFSPLRQTILVYDGNLRKEAALVKYADVSLLYQEGKGILSIKGAFYVTTKRMVFLPNDAIPHKRIVVASFSALKSLTGVRGDLTILVADSLNSIANFQFPTTKSLFQCFGLLRSLSEASRKGEDEFRREVTRVAVQNEHNDTPFSSIEVELQECTGSIEIVEAQHTDHETPVQEDWNHELLQYLVPVKDIFDYCNGLHFDIHIKARLLFVISSVAFCMKFIPFAPLVALGVIVYMLYSAWEVLEGEKPQWEMGETESTRPFARVRGFRLDYFGWRDSEKSSMVIRIAGAVFLGWVLLPVELYVTVCVLAYIWFIGRRLYRSDLVQKVVGGFWFYT